MRLGESTGITDPGRKRRRNEDSFVIYPPLFAVADGMGGAQAGEIASRLAAEAFREYHEADGLEPEARVNAIIQEANRRIYDRAQSDSQAAGMGTTITAALLEEGRIAIGHVGDSRAYRIRAGELDQLTEDHSLVADLMRTGRLTAEEAEAHPQRSVITRALGTDPEVDVDVFSVDAAPGDVFLLCSDGLTTMIGDEEILRVLGESRTLESAAKTLVEAANRRGGEDNITVVLFQLVEDPAVPERPAAADGDAHDSEDDLEDTLSGLEAPALRLETPGGAGWEPLEAVREPEPGRGGRWGRPLLWSAVGLAFAAVLLAAAFWGLSRAHFIGADEDGRVAIYQGLPWELGAGIDLYRPRYVSELRAVQLSPAERAALFDHELVSYAEARARLSRYEEEGVP